MSFIDFSNRIEKLKEDTRKSKIDYFSSIAMEEDSIIRKTKNDDLQNTAIITGGDKRIVLIRLLLSKVLPRTSDDQKAYLYLMEIVNAKKIYGDELEKDIFGIMNRNGWTTMNDKAIIYGPRRGGKSTATSAFVAVIGFVISMEINIYGNTHDTSKEFCNYIKNHFETINREYPGLLKIEKDNGKRLVFSRCDGHKTIIRILPGSVDISIILKKNNIIIIFNFGYIFFHQYIHFFIFFF